MTISDEGLELFGQIVSANAAAASHTTNTLLEIKNDQIKRLAETIVKIDRVLEAASVIDRQTEQRLRVLSGEIDSAYVTLERFDR